MSWISVSTWTKWLTWPLRPGPRAREAKYMQRKLVAGKIRASEGCPERLAKTPRFSYSLVEYYYSIKAISGSKAVLLDVGFKLASKDLVFGQHVSPCEH